MLVILNLIKRLKYYAQYGYTIVEYGSLPVLVDQIIVILLGCHWVNEARYTQATSFPYQIRHVQYDYKSVVPLPVSTESIYLKKYNLKTHDPSKIWHSILFTFTKCSATPNYFKSTPTKQRYRWSKYTE